MVNNTSKSLSSTVKSAFLPTFKEPISLSKPRFLAGLMVAKSIASAPAAPCICWSINPGTTVALGL